MTTTPEILNEQALDALIKSIGIPPRPSLLADVQREMAAPDPDPKKIALLASKDVAMSAALLKSANSVFFGLKRKAETVVQAASFLGLTQCASLLMGLITRKAIRAEGPGLSHFWDTSTKRSLAMARMAKTLRICPPDMAHTFGLFCDIGIPMLMSRFPNYSETLKEATNDCDNQFTTVEDRKHGTNHATIGALLTRSWGLAPDIITAIQCHHDYDVMKESTTSGNVAALIAMCLLAEKAIQLYQGITNHVEWEKGGDLACNILGLSDDEVEDWCDELHEMFSEEN